MYNNPILYFCGFTAIMSALIVASSFIGLLARTQPMIKRANARLIKMKGIGGNIVAALLGTITPFCSCTTVPVFAGLLTAGVETGTAMSFLIASPSIGIASMGLLLVLFGYKTALAYIVANLIVAVVGGYIIRLCNMEEPLRRSFMSVADDGGAKTPKEALIASLHLLYHFLPIVLLSALLGTVIANYIPQSFLLFMTANNSIWVIPIVVIVGAIIYADMIVLIPIGFALIEKGVNQGIVLAFMLAAAGISVPSIMLLSKVIKFRLLAYFVVILILLYMCLGVFFYFL